MQGLNLGPKAILAPSLPNELMVLLKAQLSFTDLIPCQFLSFHSSVGAGKDLRICLVEPLPCPPNKTQGHNRVPQILGDTIWGHDFGGHNCVPDSVPKSCPWGNTIVSGVGTPVLLSAGGTRSCRLQGQDKGHNQGHDLPYCVPKIVSLKLRYTIFLKIVTLSSFQGHDSGVRHDPVPGKSIPVFRVACLGPMNGEGVFFFAYLFCFFHQIFLLSTRFIRIRKNSQPFYS